jgi:hypothetical protein
MLFLWAYSLGCNRPFVDFDYDFPPGLAPLAENQASWPKNEEETISVVVGESADFFWGHARGYVHAHIDLVYACLLVEEVNVDRREIAHWTVTDDVETGYEHSYSIWNQSYESYGVSVEYSDTWRHGSTLNDEGETALIVSTWKMTDGNAFMYLKENSVVTEVVRDGVVSLDMIGHLSAVLRDGETVAQYYRDFYEELVACTNDQPYPSYSGGEVQ